jgi:hypothetical protein
MIASEAGAAAGPRLDPVESTSEPFVIQHSLAHLVVAAQV